LESNGDYTREIGYLEFANYNNASQSEEEELGNLLNRVWYQPEEVFPIGGVPEVRQHAFWVPVDRSYYGLSAKITVINLSNLTLLLSKTLGIRQELLRNPNYRDFRH